jgi:hypothetical protein
MHTLLHLRRRARSLFKTSLNTARYGLKQDIAVEQRKFCMSQASVAIKAHLQGLPPR